MTGAFLFFALYSGLHWPLFLSFALTLFGITFLGIFIEKTTFRPVRDKQEFIPLILSIGVSIILVSTVTMIFGGGSQTYIEAAPTIFHLMQDSVITLPQVLIIITSCIVIAGLFLFLRMTKIGKAIRAVSDNKMVASILGIDVNKTIMMTFALASFLAALGGILVAFDQNLSPRMGLALSIKVFAAITLGGVGNLFGAVIGAFIIGFTENFLIAYTSVPGSFKEAFVFMILIFVLLFRPYGLFGGKKEEMESR